MAQTLCFTILPQSEQVIQGEQYHREYQTNTKGGKKINHNITAIQPHDLEIKRIGEMALQRLQKLVYLLPD